jgi:hypothetical protein
MLENSGKGRSKGVFDGPNLGTLWTDLYFEYMIEIAQ